jgi:asparagine synthase (glutamine-hydrolysing)
MCGFAGFSGPFSGDLLARMNRSIAHRGPDDEGLWHDAARGVGLAHRRLSIIDLSPNGHQPMWDATHTAVIAFNGEIYDYQALRRGLVDRGYQFRSTSDTEVLLNLYLRDGVDMLSKLNGIFAFALWDSRDQSLLLARDGLGVKPLYYGQARPSSGGGSGGEGGVLFASEIKALLQEPSLDRTLDPEAIQYYLTYLWCPAPHTMLRAVRKLPPGNAMVLRTGKIVRQWQFYELPYDQPIKPYTPADAAAEVEQAIAKAVARQMVADVPVGVFLSGGLDSSSLTHFARQHATGRLQCFTIGFKDRVAANEGMTEDLPYAQRVAEKLGVDLHTVYVDSQQMISQVERMLYHLDEPQADPAAINTMLICELARQHGVKVLLSGAGGDDIFSGYRRHVALTHERYWSWLPTALRAALRAGTQVLPQGGALGRRLARAFEYADLGRDQRLISYFFHTPPHVADQLLNPAFSDGLGSPFAPLEQSLTHVPPGCAPLNRMLFLDAKHFLADHNLNYVDKMSMAHGVEVRVPLLDPDLVHLAAGLPVDLKLRGATTKWIFKKAMEPYLPSDIIYRPKTGFAVPLRHWLGHEMSDYVRDLLADDSIRRRGIFDPAAVHRVYEQYQRGGADRAYTVFAVLCIELWCRLFVDRVPQAPPSPPETAQPAAAVA